VKRKRTKLPPDIQKMLKQHMRATKLAVTWSTEVVDATEEGRKKDAKYARERALYWIRRVLKLEGKL
jgi:hypothetical protein